ncbi:MULTISPECIES: response regulator transcription factor [Rhodomicrobium]|uniref:response regulator transcription factor n=1 Tax=Rhodomicrobium TaxID=1068 RepID=UPI0014825FF4|nr:MULTISPECIES: response regulator transcription factor [Rhodomicrobium]
MTYHEQIIGAATPYIPFQGPAEHAELLGNILVVDEDASYRAQLACFLKDQNCRARIALASDDIAGLIKHGPFGVVLLDIEAGGGAGLDRLREIRRYSDIPVLVTGRRMDAVDRILAFDLGADGHLVKPFDMRELWAQARAVHRRQALGRLTHAGRCERGFYRFNGWELDRRTRVLSDPAGLPVAIGRSPYALLLAFLDAPGRPLSRLQLMQATRACEDVYDRSVDVQVLRLRRTLRQVGEKSCIRTVRGHGYVFDARVERVY